MNILTKLTRKIFLLEHKLFIHVLQWLIFMMMTFLVLFESDDIVTRHGSKIDFVSIPETETSFIISLPLINPE